MAKHRLHNLSRSVISLSRVVCCVVFLGNLCNSQLLTEKRRLAARPDPLGKFLPELYREFLFASSYKFAI